ncbi:MAG TPA: DUF6141 family protein [Candidatus Eremiobacteraeota bacterium]|nr:MAG: hypothetical protein BWY64_00434 [bacterium ADurb.Bin363]HPZ08245.1 DUF6141 family protein [Candidatus Eremiobacteraeota bacterium]
MSEEFKNKEFTYKTRLMDSKFKSQKISAVELYEDVPSYSKNAVLFMEVQQFRQAWLWVSILILAVIAWGSLMYQIRLFTASTAGNIFPVHPLVFVLSWIVFGILSPLFLYMNKFVIKVCYDAVYIQYFPFHFSFRKIYLEHIKRYKVRTYSAIKEFRGWGIRTGKNTRAYTVSGIHGVLLELKDGKKILLGSQKAEELERAIYNAENLKGTTGLDYKYWTR